MPVAFSVFMVLVQLFGALVTSIKTKTFIPFFETFSRVIASADYNIWYQVQIAKNTPEAFGLYNMLVILSSIFILWFFIKKINQLIAFALTNSSLEGGIIVFNSFLKIPFFIQ